MGEKSRDLLLTPTGQWSAARIKYTFKLTSYIKPDKLLEKVAKKFKRQTGPMSENQWSKIIDAKGGTGERYFNYLVRNNVMVPEETKSNGNRHYDLYSLNKDKLVEEIQDSEITEDVFNAAEYIVNEAVDGKKVRKDY